MRTTAMINFDKYGLVIQTDGDGGDSGARTGLFYFLNTLQGIDASYMFQWTLKYVTVSKDPLTLFRNPVNYTDPKDFSRDQTNPLLMAMGALDLPDLLKSWWKGLIGRWGFYQNGDFAGPQDWGMYFRARKMKLAYPFLLFSDLFLVLNSVLRCIYGRDPNNVGDDINHTMMLLQAIVRYPTPISFLARKIYAKLRPGGVQQAWDTYFSPASHANPFNDMARDLITMYFT